jgi:hypothetical protein
MIFAGHGRVKAATLPTMANVPCVLAETMTPAASDGYGAPLCRLFKKWVLR